MKPRVTVNPVANHYAGKDERIIEFSHAVNGRMFGGLISFTPHPDGTSLAINLYRLDEGVIVYENPARREAQP